ncbi:intermembrane phospholipid transport protein YdbH family protein [Alteraurantiacibacter aestuarii]|uniref:Dicarboxylate transport domain-containing protein n=1 Tax=Alteraurantiacibacter aestuarii TaxID=650004 RepID=A0A844ZJQ5_9SPHN|nr:YdbH domain-containing protein [Alteraurantiacibacter aestuarii]MXO87703.1 hypothetical protein [Alteraurantiacibacter aestuarii]
MAHESSHAAPEVAPRRKRRIGRAIALLLLLALVVALALAWIRREQIAQQLITDMLDGYGVEATYDIESIEPGAQVLTNIVIGDPAAPDLTIERAEIRLEPRLGLPSVSHLILDQPRLFGTIIDGELSFGALDPLVFTGEEGPFEFPDMRLTVHDGRALVEGDYGPLALRLEGAGHLRGGFAGELAGVAPMLHLPGCEARQATIFGALEIDAERPQFEGPVRFDALSCADGGLAMQDGAIALTLRADRNLADLEGEVGMRLGQSDLVGNRIAAMQGEGDFAWRDGNLIASYDVQGRDITTPAARIAALAIEGTVRGRDQFAMVDVEAQASGTNIIPGAALMQTLADSAQAAEGTLIAPLLGKLGRQLAAETRGSTFSASLIARRKDDRLSLTVPQANLRGRSGASLLALSRAQLAFPETGPDSGPDSGGDSGLPLFSGNFITGGTGLPRISGRMEQGASGALELRMQMPDYAAGDAHLALPDLHLTQSRNGALTFTGNLVASGALPGGFASDLAVPLTGRISSSGALSMWDGCTAVRFDRLVVSSLELGRQQVTLCPPSGSPILSYGPGGLALAAGTPSLQLAGMLGETPIRIASGPVGIAYPGALSARNLDIEMGPVASPMKFVLEDVSAQLGEEISGIFTGVDVLLDAVPLDVLRASGNWRFTAGRLDISDARFTLEDRQAVDRFNPLTAQGATLSLADNRITSAFELHHPASDARVVNVTMAHDLGTAAGHADLLVNALTFRPDFQPRDLSELSYGVVSLVDGTVTGRGRIDWDAQAITSTGTFSSDRLDLAAAFGPVKGARGTVVFTDLLGLTTAPGQRIYIDAINPGIEVYDGEVAFSLRGGTLLELEEARWPFMGGELTMRPLTMSIGVEEVRRYVFDLRGLEASRFIDHMDLNNLSASGMFDGTIPIVFDAMGNGQLEGGQLVARPPGGNVSYVGELTYEDMTPMVNFAFAALRSLDYREMSIAMNGPLTGELVTRVRFDGVSQGQGTQSNFITRRIANLPIRFIVNVRAPFYQMMTDLRSLYDPSAVRDPRTLGLMSDDGTRFVPGNRQRPATLPDESDIQPPESEAMP